MIIRPANLDDIEGIYRCASDFFEYAKYAEQNLPLCKESFCSAVKEYIEKGVVLLLSNGDDVCGGIAGIIAPWTFNRSIKIMLEFFFWIDPEYRGIHAIKMMKEFEKKSRSMGADFIYMVSVNTFMQDGVDRLYKKLGYSFAEQFHIKEL